MLLIPNAALRFKPADASGAAASNSGIAGALMPRGPRRGGAAGDTVKRGGSQTVYVKGEDGKPQPVQIITGETNGSLTEVIGGNLRQGMEVITGQLAANASSAAASGQRRRQGAGGAGGQ